MLSLGAGVGITHLPPVAPFTLGSLSGKLLLLDARTIAGSNGDALATISDASGLGNDFLQGTGAAKPTLATSWAGSKAVAFSGSQFASCGVPILNGQTKFSLAWVGQFTSVTSVRVPFFFGNNGTGNGFDLNSNRNSAGKFGVFVRGVAAVDSGTASDTGNHFFVVTYDSTASPKWTMAIDGVAQTLANGTIAPVDPTTRAVIGATDITPNFGFIGKMGLLLVCSGVWEAGVIAAIHANARSSWTSLP